MSSKKSTNPMQYRIEVNGRVPVKKYYRSPGTAYKSYERYCEDYKDSEVMLFDNLYNELIYRRDGVSTEQKSDNNSDNRMRYKVLVEFNNGRVDKYRYFRYEDSARKYYAECVERNQEDWAGILDRVSFIDVLEDKCTCFVAYDTDSSSDDDKGNSKSEDFFDVTNGMREDSPMIVHFDASDSSKELSSDKDEKKESFLHRLSKKIKKCYFRLLKSNPR